MTDRIRWGIISTARIGLNSVIPAIEASGNGVVSAISSRSLESAQAAAAEIGIPHAYGSYTDLIESGEVDAIYNPLPNHLHAEWSIACAEAGIPTLCEKPLALNATEAQRMVDAFAARDVLLGEAFMYRYHPQHDRVRDLMDEGAIGEVQSIRSAFTFRIGNEEDIRLRADMGGGGVMDVGCYCINAMRLLTGEEPEDVAAIANFGAVSGVDEHLAALLRFPSGIIGHFHCGLRTYREHRYVVSGSTGRIVVPQAFGPKTGTPTVIRLETDDTARVIELPDVNQYVLMVEDFAGAILENRPLRFPIEDGVRNMAVIDRLLASARGA
ncbi:MAG: Gfo/Idh/MocA family oxidoreductase [Anaerolineae bacterium]|nr:Gfo/Idh/MocA family oxidoreductase [Anaerolineae bacterium]